MNVLCLYYQVSLAHGRLEAVVALEQVLHVSLVFLDQARYVVLVVDVLARLVQGESLEALVLLVPQLDPLGRQQLVHHVFLDVAFAFGVQDAEGGEHVLGRGGFELVGLQHLEQVGLELLVLDVVGGLVVLQLGDDIVPDLGFRGELQQVPHDVTHFPTHSN